MAFSFADLGYWRLALLTLAFEASHVLLVGYWPEIKGARLGPRPMNAKVFMLLEFLSLMATLAAAIGGISRLFGLGAPPKGKMFGIAISAVALLGLFFLVWEY